MAEISTDIYRAELAMENWMAWQNDSVSYRLNLDGSSGKYRMVFVNEKEALKIEGILLRLKAYNRNTYKALVTYFENRDHKFLKSIAEMLNICDDTLRSRVDFGLEYVAGELI